MEIYQKEKPINLINWVLLIFILAISIRLFINFSQDFIPGINGGYYPLQVREILENSCLKFSDMPFLFYLNAFILKFISFFGVSITDTLILNTVRIIDSISLPFLLFPLYRIIQLNNINGILPISLLTFAVLSFSPLILTSDLQKNALAIVFLFASISYYLDYQNENKKSFFYLSILFLILSGLTHFGTSVFGLLLAILIISYNYKKKAIFPIMIFLITTLSIIFIIDKSRFNRLFLFWTVIFEKPALLTGMLSPMHFLIIIFSIFLAIVGILTLKSKNKNLENVKKSFIFACIISLLICSFPLLDEEYFKRLSLFLFIPQVILIIMLAFILNDKQKKIISIFLFIFTFLSIIMIIVKPKKAVINKEEYIDLKNIEQIISDKKETIIIAKHGLEWWIGWVLNTKIMQEKNIDKSLFDKYKNILIINQINNLNNEIHKPDFHNSFQPPPLDNNKIIYSSNFLKVYKLK